MMRLMKWSTDLICVCLWKSSDPVFAHHKRTRKKRIVR